MPSIVRRRDGGVMFVGKGISTRSGVLWENSVLSRSSLWRWEVMVVGAVCGGVVVSLWT